MAIKYYSAEDVQKLAHDLVMRLGWNHIHLEHLGYLRSMGSTSRGTIARCHALGKAMQIGMGRKLSFYMIEVISEQYDRLPESEKVKTIIHELMHIPKTFGGGFRQHDFVCEENVDVMFDKLVRLGTIEKPLQSGFLPFWKV